MWCEMVGWVRPRPAVKSQMQIGDAALHSEAPIVRRADLMKALCDPTRLTMGASLWRAAPPICICDFTAGLGLTQPTISHHMAKLKEAGLVESEKRGIWIYYRLRDNLPTETRELLSRLID